jgi:hypothetical protein
MHLTSFKRPDGHERAITATKIVAVMVSLLAVFPAGSVAQARSGDFCESNLILRDYEGPLADFPKAGRFPASGRLQVGPKNLRLFPPRARLVVIGHEGFEAQGRLASAQASAKPLGWWAVSRLVRVGRADAKGKIVRVRRQYIPTIRSFGLRNFGFGGTVRPGFYRLTVTFEGASEKIFGKYSEYYRALRARSELNLGLSETNLHPGDIGLLRVENYGTLNSSYSYEYKIWTAGDRSSELPLEPMLVTNDRPFARAGRTGKCFQFKVPSDTPIGEYEIGVYATSALLNQPVLLPGTFRVLP